MTLPNRKHEPYAGGKNDWSGAAEKASRCPSFRPDVEDELVAEEPVSCYNCLFRRWTADSFVCMAASVGA